MHFRQMAEHEAKDMKPKQIQSHGRRTVIEVLHWSTNFFPETNFNQRAFKQLRDVIRQQEEKDKEEEAKKEEEEGKSDEEDDDDDGEEEEDQDMKKKISREEEDRR